jgi:P-type Ca2+ transporter type 2C
LDGETLRSRSDSFNSNAATVVRSRAGSTAISEPAGEAYDDVLLSEALTPDPYHEADFRVDDNKFAFSPGQLNKLLNPKSLAAFRALGGLDGLARGLQTDLTAGLSIDECVLDRYVTFDQATGASISKKRGDVEPQTVQLKSMTLLSDAGSQFADRVRIFSRNRLPDRKRTSFFKLLWDAYNDKTLILLTFAAVISLSLGIYEAMGGGSAADWIEGVAICVAIILVIVVTAANDWQKDKQFAKLSKRVSASILLA